MQHVVLPIAALFTTGVVLSVNENRFAYGSLQLDTDEPLHVQMKGIQVVNNMRLLEIKIMYTLAVVFWLFLGVGSYTARPTLPPQPTTLVESALAKKSEKT
jgi:hypothetical protein